MVLGQSFKTVGFQNKALIFVNDLTTFFGG